MRNFVEITGGKLKRVSNRRDGFYNSRTDDDDDRSRADHRRERRASRQQLRLAAGQLTDGDDSGLEASDFPRGGTTTIINTDSGRGYASIR